MAFNGSGTFVRVHDWTTDRDADVPIDADRMDDEMDGMATGLSTAICRDGQSTTTAAIPFAVGLQVNNGTAAAPSIAFTSDTNTGIYREGADNLGISAGGTSRFQVGTTAVASLLPMFGVNGSAALPTYAFSNDTDTGVFLSTANAVGVGTGGVERVTLTTASFTSIVPILAPAGTAAAPSHSFSGDADSGIYSASANVVGFSSGGTSRGLISASGELLWGPDAATFSIGSTANAVDGFGVSAVGLGHFARNSASAKLVIQTHTLPGTANQVSFVHSAAVVGSISSTSTTTAYNTSSDERLKTNFRSLKDVGAIIDALNPGSWTWTHVSGATGIGFKAQEVAQIVPEAVLTGDDDPDKRPGDDGFQGWVMDLSKLVPYLVAEVKSLRTRVAALEGA